MKYIGYWDYDSKDEKEVIAAYMRMLEQMAEEPEKWAKMIGDEMVIGGCGKGYTIYEADEPDQLGRVCVWMAPWCHYNFVPIFNVPAQMVLVEERNKFLAEAEKTEK